MPHGYAAVPVDAPSAARFGSKGPASIASVSPSRVSVRLGNGPTFISDAGSRPPSVAPSIEADVRTRLERVRGGVRRSMEDIERTLLEDIEFATGPITAASAGLSPARLQGAVPPPSHPPIQASAEFRRVREDLLPASRLPRRDQVTQTNVPPTMSAEGADGRQLFVGSWCLIRPEWEVRRLCGQGAAGWHDGMLRYCNGQAVGRIVFAKPGCDSVDVAFPDGSAWLFPAAAAVPYKPPVRLSDLATYPESADAGTDPEGSAFIDGLRENIRKRELINRTNELQIRCVEDFISVYEQEARERRKLLHAFHELMQMAQVERAQPVAAPRLPAPYAQQHLRGASPFALPDVSSLRSVSPTRADHLRGGPQVHGPPPAFGGPPGGPPASRGGPPGDDSWEVAGVSESGHYVFRAAPGRSHPTAPIAPPEPSGPPNRRHGLLAKEALL